jgi:hypothetical protein
VRKVKNYLMQTQGRMVFKYPIEIGRKLECTKNFTSDISADEAVPRLEGSTASKVSSRFAAVAGR